MEYLILILLGILAGFVVNFIAEWFYLRRKFFPKDLEEQYRDISILRFIFLPWKWKERLISHKIRVLLVYVLLAGGAVWMWSWTDDILIFVSKFIVMTYFVLVVVMDIEARVVLHPVSIAGAVIGLGYGWSTWGIVSTLIGGAAGYIFMFAVYWIGIKLSKYASKKRGVEIDDEPMGFGDVNLTGVLGLMLGWPGVIAGLLLGIFTGGGFSALLIIQKIINKDFKLGQTMPYAPFLVIGAAIIILLY